MTIPIDQHKTEIDENLRSWQRKKVLRRIYEDFYRIIARRISEERKGVVVEIGSGLGKIKTVIPNCITSDIFQHGWLDRVEDAYSLSFGDRSVSTIILFDVWHHLQYPGLALNEFQRALEDQGRVIMFEPAMGLLGRIAYGLFHHEPLGMNVPITWRPEASFVPQQQTYYAAQGNCWRMFFLGEGRMRLTEWDIVEVSCFSALSYVASGGFSGPQLYPGFLLSAMKAIEKILDRLPRLFATRMLVVLQKKERAV